MIPTRETSGLEIVINDKGSMRLVVNGKIIPSSNISIESKVGADADSCAYVKIPTRFITFRHGE